MSTIIKLERKNRLEKRLFELESGVTVNSPIKNQIHNLIDLYIAYQRVQDKNWPYINEDGLKTYKIKVISNLVNFISLDPFMNRVRAAIATLLSGNVQKAIEILQSILDEQNEIISDIQRKNRTGANSPSEYKELLIRIYKTNPEMGPKEMLKKLKMEIGKGVIKSIDLNLDEITTVDSSVYQINGLKDYIYRFRAKEV
jgi:hypothetical protein